MKTIRLLLLLALTTESLFAARPKQPTVQPLFANAPEKTLTGVASWYGGERTANGEYCNGRDKTAAHKSLPFGTWVRVTDQRSGRSTIVRINDRGPYVKGRVIDLSRAAASEIGLTNRGVAKVKLEILRPVTPERYALEIAGRNTIASHFTAWLPLSLFISSHALPTAPL